VRKFKEAWIIDDNWLDTFGIKRLMKFVGFSSRIFTFSDAYEAINQLTLLANEHSDKCPDVILLDIKMPEWDGWKFLDMLKELSVSKNIKLCLISNVITSEEINKAGQYEIISQYFQKPITSKKLKEIMALPQ
jgi:response regulator RpfG family c-di-GMP phosphodiesterase